MSGYESVSCYKQRLRMMFNEPPPRLEIVSPYTTNGGGYTKSQLDMRRKAEILQYKTSTKSGSNNRLTRAERFSKLATGSRIVNARVQSAENSCENKPTLSNRSGIPGKPVTLFLDKMVPLYNYKTNIRDYASLEKEADVPWKLFLDKTFPTYQSNIPYSLGVLEMREGNREAISTFELVVPYTFQQPNDSITDVTSDVLFSGRPIIKLEPFVYSSNSGELKIRNIRLYSASEYIYVLQLKVITNSGHAIHILFDQIQINLDVQP